MAKRVVVVGGVAGGMSCAARLKRLDDSLEVTVFEKGADVSFANCGMPYFIGGVISNRSALHVQSAQGLRARYSLDVRPRHEVVRIDRSAKAVRVRNLDTGEELTQPYDTLVLSPGAAPILPPLPGIDGANVFVLSNLNDMDRIAMAAAKGGHACIIGAGFIGLELTENLRARKVNVSLVERLPHVVPTLDPEMAQPVLQELRQQGVQVYLSESATAIDGAHVLLKSGGVIESDFVCVCVGMRPMTGIAGDAGLELNERGYIRVDQHLRTSDPNIYALGDAVETLELVTGAPAAIPLAGPANRQGRIAADHIAGRVEAAYRGTQGTAIVHVFNVTAAHTGLNERQIREAGHPYLRAYVHPTQRPRYYPGSQMLDVKLLFSQEGKIYGAQVIGGEGVEPMINALAQAIRAGSTVEDLEYLELAYAPQWGGAKHGVNLVGYVANNIIKGDLEVVEADNFPEDVYWLDVRMHAEAEAGTIPGSTVIPVDELRKRVQELPKGREIAVFCAVGLRGHIAYRFLKQKGFNVRNLNGGYRTWACFNPREKATPQSGAAVKSVPAAAPATKSQSSDADSKPSAPAAAPAPALSSGPAIKLDCTGMQCPGPLVRLKSQLDAMPSGAVLEITASDPGFAMDLPVWCEQTGHTLSEMKSQHGRYTARVTKGSGAVVPATGGKTKNKKTLLCFSQDLDRALATFMVANGAASMGSEVTIFFTFWGLNLLRRRPAPKTTKSLLDRMFGLMMPSGIDKLRLSRLNMFGLGTWLMKYVMRTKNVMTLDELVRTAQASGVKFVACSTTMDIMGFSKQELIDGVEIGGAATFLASATESNATLVF